MTKPVAFNYEKYSDVTADLLIAQAEIKMLKDELKAAYMRSAICGKVVQMHGPQKCCPECAALVMSSKKKKQTCEERRCEIRREAHIKKYEERKRKLAQTNDAARAAGMSYGQYTAMLRMKEELCTSK